MRTDEAEPKGRTGHLRLGRAPRRYVRARSVACMHCDTGHAVQIEPRLRSRSPENGNISNIRRRLSAISLRDWPNSASRDRPQFAKAPHWRGFLTLLRVKSPVARLAGWGGRIRTSAWWNQNPLPYHLATPQQAGRKAAGVGLAGGFSGPCGP